MKPCEKCIHEDVCLLHEDNFMADANKNGFCGKFKNKADFVEVVRCKDCKHSNDDGTICRYSVGREVEPEHYCSYGERSDT